MLLNFLWIYVLRFIQTKKYENTKGTNIIIRQINIDILKNEGKVKLHLKLKFVLRSPRLVIRLLSRILCIRLPVYY